MNEPEALALLDARLGDTPKSGHSRAVGEMLRVLAAQCGADPILWALTGFCHDLDYWETQDDRTRHGILTAQWLGDRLPPEALDAIRAHDHRTGVTATSALAQALRLTDILVVRAEKEVSDSLAVAAGRVPDSREMPDLDGAVQELLPFVPLSLQAATQLAHQVVCSRRPVGEATNTGVLCQAAPVQEPQDGHVGTEAWGDDPK